MADRRHTIQSSNSEGVSPEMLSAIRADLGQSPRRFGLTLKRVIDPRAARGFSKNYITMLEHGKAGITPAIGCAVLVLAAMLDGQDEVQARARKVEVLAVHDIEGAVVLGEKRLCALAGCRVWFVPSSPAQRFHAPACRKTAAARRRLADSEKRKEQ